MLKTGEEFHTIQDETLYEEELDFDAKLTDEYWSNFAVEINTALLSMKDEEVRKPEMEIDAERKACKIHEQVFYSHGESYQKMIRRICSTLDGKDVTLNLPENSNWEEMEYPFEYLARHLTFELGAKESICQAVSDGIFDILGLDEDKRPPLRLVTTYKGRRSKNDQSTSESDDKILLGHYAHPSKANGKQNGSISIILPNFEDNAAIYDILDTLEHECFHAYQYNCQRGNMPLETVRDRVMMAAYIDGSEEYINYKNDFAGYYKQGYESSARRFSEYLSRANEELITNAIKRSVLGGEDE